MTTFKLTSWNNTAPASYADYDEALAEAKARAAAEGKMVKLIDVAINEERTVSPNGDLGSWQHTEG